MCEISVFLEDTLSKAQFEAKQELENTMNLRSDKLELYKKIEETLK